VCSNLETENHFSFSSINITESLSARRHVAELHVVDHALPQRRDPFNPAAEPQQEAKKPEVQNASEE
jgi:hypothetical protein